MTSTANAMTIAQALQFANQAQRGGLSALGSLLKGLSEGAVYDTYAGNPTSNLTPKAKGSWCLDTTNNIWYRAKALTNTDWIAIGEHGLTAAELTVLNVVAGTGAVSKALVLDSNGDVTIPGIVDLDGNVLATGEGSGITSGTGTVHKMFAQKQGELFITKIYVDLTGLNSNAAADIIGDDAAANCHIGQIIAVESGTIVGGIMTCLEAPATGEPDIDLYSATEATGTEDAAVTGLTETALLATGADWTIDLVRALTAFPAANEYLYLVGSGGGTDATYTAGKFLIELYGT